MNEIEIAHKLRTDPSTRSKFLGVFAADEVTQVRVCSFPAFLIANTGFRKAGGQHWVCIFFEGRHCEYFDSLGNDVLAVFLPTINRYSDQYICLTKPVQKSGTNTCGLFCLDFAFARCSGVSFDLYVHKFDFDKLQRNEWDIYYKWCVSKNFKASVC